MKNYTTQTSELYLSSLIAGFVASQVTIAGIEDFRFYDLTVTVCDINGVPVPGVSVRTYSKDWYISYPAAYEFLITDVNGSCKFNLPIGEWTIVAGGGNRFVSWQSGIALYLVASIDLETNTTIQIQPDHSVLLSFLDRNAAHSNVDDIHVCPSDLVPNCRMPKVGTTNNGQSILFTNANSPMTVFFARVPNSTKEGYFIFSHNMDPNSNAIVRGYGTGIKYILFDGRNPSNSAGRVCWLLCFPNEDMPLRYVNKAFVLNGQGEAYLSSDYMDYMFYVWMRGDMRNDDIYYWSQYQGLDLKENTSFTLQAGGPITRQFHFCPIPFDSSRVQFLFGPIFDAYGNEIRFYYPANSATPRFSLPITIWEYQGSPILYENNFVVDFGSNFGFEIKQFFPMSAVFRLEWDLGPWGGTNVLEGRLFDPQYSYGYEVVTSPNYEIRAALWQSATAEVLKDQLENAYSLFVNLAGTEPPPTHTNVFNIHPLGGWCSPVGGVEVYYGGFSWWHPKNPGSNDWEHTALHEIGHRLQADIFVPWSSPWFLRNTNGALNEGAAEIIRQYIEQGLHGEKSVRWQKAMAVEWFFSYLKNPVNSSKSTNLYFFLDVYLPRRFGWRIHELFFRNWVSVCKAMNDYGYNQQTIYTALYSVLYGENLAWAFQLCDLNVSEDQVAQAMQRIQDEFPIDETSLPSE